MSKESNADVGTLEWYPSTKGNDLNLVDLPKLKDLAHKHINSARLPTL